MNRLLLAAVIALATPIASLAQPAPQPVLVTRVFDLGPILGEKGKANGIPDVDTVVKLLLETLSVRELKPGSNGLQIVEREGNKLEVRGSRKQLEEINELLDALARIADVAVDVRVEVLELEPDSYKKLAGVLPKQPSDRVPSPILFATCEELDAKDAAARDKKKLEEILLVLKSAKIIQTSNGRYLNGLESHVATRLSLQTYPSSGAGGKPQIAKEGFKLQGLPVVSRDRRFVRMRLCESSVAITGIKKVELGEPPVEGQKMTAASLELEDMGSSGSATVEDGGAIFYRLSYAPRDKVWLAVVRPTIYIQAEDEIRNQKK